MDPADEYYVLRFECPRCAHVVADDFELIDIGVPADWRCDACRRIFNVLLTECELCGCESVHVALACAEQADANHVFCHRCGNPNLSNEDLAQSVAGL